MCINSRTLLFALTVALFFISCSSKQETKSNLIANIEQYNIDTVVAKPLDKPYEQMTDAEKCRYKADEVLRKYPEAYSAANNLTEKYNLWLECEQNFIRLVFVDNDNQRSKILSSNQKQLSKRLEQMNAIEPLCAAIYDENNADVLKPLNLSETPKQETFNEAYKAIMMAVNIMYGKGKRAGKPDERLTACSLANKAWNDYVSSFEKFLTTVPEECRERVSIGLARIQKLHLIDIKNCYLTYWSNDKPGYLIPDDVADNNPFVKGNEEIFHYIQ